MIKPLSIDLLCLRSLSSSKPSLASFAFSYLYLLCLISILLYTLQSFASVSPTYSSQRFSFVPAYCFQLLLVHSLVSPLSHHNSLTMQTPTSKKSAFSPLVSELFIGLARKSGIRHPQMHVSHRICKLGCFHGRDFWQRREKRYLSLHFY